MTTTLASLEAFAEARGADFDPTDLRAIQALEGASDRIRRYTGRTFDRTEDDEVTLSGTGTDALLLPDPPAETPTEIVLLDADGDETAVEVTDVRLDPEGILYRLTGVWPVGRRNVVVTYTHGYTLPSHHDPGTLPADLQMATIELARRWFDQSAGNGQVQSKSIGTFAVTYADLATVLPSGQTLGDVLDGYRLVTVG